MSPATRFEAVETNATNRPLAEITTRALPLEPLASTPAVETLARAVTGPAPALGETHIAAPSTAMTIAAVAR